MASLRDLPKVDALSDNERLLEFPRQIRVEAARAAVEALRQAVLAGHEMEVDPIEMAVNEAHRRLAASLRPAINVSGVVLHTGLGRARLARSVVDHLSCVAAGHASVELDLASGTRGNRQCHVRELLVKLTGAESALVVNNAAAGVTLALTALAQGREVILSRGQMVEIGGSFRMPDIVAQSGCRLVEVGCTNKTRLSDYRERIGVGTAAILRCHPSNFRIVGFTSEPNLQELASLAREHEILCIDDVGSGCLVDTSRFGLPKEPTLADGIRAGADLVIASGDKMLGGPQAGLIIGGAAVIERLERHPLARAVRVDKMTLAALEATLRLYDQGRELEIPTLSYLARSAEEVRAMASDLAEGIAGAEVRQSQTEVGGGSAPGVGLPTWCVVIQTSDSEALASALRAHRPAIVGRIQDDRVWLDPRTLDSNELPIVRAALEGLV